MKVRSFPQVSDLVDALVSHIETQAELAISARGRFVFAASGGKSPRPLYEALRRAQLDYSRTHLFQVDERILPAGDPGRNRTLLEEAWLSKLAVKPELHWMPVEVEPEAAAEVYEREVRSLFGDRLPRFDLIHLGLGADGHTASLCPGDNAALEERRKLIVPTVPYQGTRRLTMTFPLLQQGRELLWFVTGTDKAEAFRALTQKDLSIPAARLSETPATAFVSPLP